MTANLLEATFPGLARGAYTVTSPRSQQYNCIAWAAGDASNWWWPGPNLEAEYWPAAVARVETLDAFQAVFASLRYVVCESGDVEPGFEKVAIFADNNNAPKHAARQLPNGRWTSKIGALEDIEHALRDLEGEEYGSVVVFMKRAISP